jgi:hypothetical protein
MTIAFLAMPIDAQSNPLVDREFGDHVMHMEELVP